MRFAKTNSESFSYAHPQAKQKLYDNTAFCVQTTFITLPGLISTVWGGSCYFQSFEESEANDFSSDHMASK